jgi:manganese/zinc/iron transport system substrate-binding protein
MKSFFDLFFRKKILFGLLVLLACLSSCVNRDERPKNEGQNQIAEWMEPNGKIKTLSTIAMINDLVKQVGGDYVDSLSLIRGDLNPHSYQLVKGDDEKLGFADLIFSNGLNLEHGPSLHRYLQESKKSVSLGDKLSEKYPDLIIHIRNQVDPHIWMDISLWMKTIPFIVEALSERDPQHAAEFQANADHLIKEMETAHKEIRRELHALPPEKRYLVTTHDAFFYFTRAYLAADDEKTMEEWQARFVAPEGLAPESQLSVAQIQGIINHLAQYHINVMFPESNISKDSLRKILFAGRERGLPIRLSTVPLYADAMGPPGSDGDTYIKMMKHDATTIAKDLMSNHEKK